MTPTKETAFRRNTAPGPAAATISPPRAGPPERAMVKPTPPSAAAAGNSARETSSGVIACQAGTLSAVPAPSAQVRPSSTHGVVRPRSVSTPIAAAAAHIQPCVKSNRRRRSTMSARAPPGRASRKIGRLSAVCRSETRSGEAVWSVINHASPTSSIHVPRFETTETTHKARKREWRKGDHAEGWSVDVLIAYHLWNRSARILHLRFSTAEPSRARSPRPPVWLGAAILDVFPCLLNRLLDPGDGLIEIVRSRLDTPLV